MTIHTTASLEATDAASQAVQKTPNRVSLDKLKDRIDCVQYLNPDIEPTLTVAFVRMKNGFIVIGHSAPADPANFDRDLGREFALENAVRQIWPMEGYLLRERLANEARYQNWRRGDTPEPPDAGESAAVLQFLEEWTPDTFPASPSGQVHFGRAMLEMAQECIRGHLVRPPAATNLNDAAVETMVQRFLTWKLPADFNPDGGITFTAEHSQNSPWPGRHEPVGTNLLTYPQAMAMVRHMLAGLSSEAAHG